LIERVINRLIMCELQNVFVRRIGVPPLSENWVTRPACSARMEITGLKNLPEIHSFFPNSESNYRIY